jgi:uncharacterized protein (DUF1810 family)
LNDEIYAAILKDLQRDIKIDHWIWVVCLRCKIDENTSDVSRYFALRSEGDFVKLCKNELWLTRFLELNRILDHKDLRTFLSPVDYDKWINSKFLYRRLYIKGKGQLWNQKCLDALVELAGIWTGNFN